MKNPSNISTLFVPHPTATSAPLSSSLPYLGHLPPPQNLTRSQCHPCASTTPPPPPTRNLCSTENLKEPIQFHKNSCSSSTFQGTRTKFLIFSLLNLIRLDKKGAKFMFQGTKCGGKMGVWVQGESLGRLQDLSCQLGMGLWEQQRILEAMEIKIKNNNSEADFIPLPRLMYLSSGMGPT